MPLPVAQLQAIITADATQAEATMTSLAARMGVGGALSLAAGAAVAAVGIVGVAATKMAGDFQAGITSLATGAGESVKNLGMVSAGILQLAQDTGTSTKQLVAGMYMIESGGFHGAAGLAILKAAAEGAKVGNADLGVVADTVDTILKNFGENGALTATQATNALITTVANGKTHLEDLAQSLAFVLPAASAAGLGLKDVMGAMATLTSVGIPAAEASTYLRQTIIALEAPASGARKALADIGITTQQLGDAMKHGLPDALQLIETQLAKHGIQRGSAAYVAAIREISGGTRQMQGMLNLMGPHLETFRQDVTKIGSAAGATGNQVLGWQLVQHTFNQQLDKAGASIQVMFIQLGQHLLPVATQFVTWITANALPAIKQFVGWITGASDSAQILRPILAALAIAVGILLVASLGAAAAGFIAVNIASMGTIAAIALIVLAVAGIVKLFQHWYATNEGVRNAVNFLGNAIRAYLTTAIHFMQAELNLVLPLLRAAAQWIGTQLHNAAVRLAPVVRQVAGAIGHFATEVQARLGPIIAVWGPRLQAFAQFSIRLIGSELRVLQGIWNAAWPFMSAVLRMVWGIIQGVVRAGWAVISGIIKVGMDILSGNWKGAWRDLQQTVKDFASGLLQVVQSVITGIGNLGTAMFNAGKNLIGMLINGIKSMAGNVGQAAGDIAGKIKNLLGFGSPTKEGPGATSDKWMPNLMKMLASTLAASSGDFGGAVQKVAGTIAVNFSTGGLGTGGSKLSTLPSGLSGGSGGGSGNLVIQVKMDGRKVAEATVPHIHKVIRNATGRRDM